MPNAWMEALKEYNKGSNSWCIVKKGTSEYDKVQQIMKNIKNPVKKTQQEIIKESNKRMKVASKLALAETRAIHKRAQAIKNPSNKAIVETNKSEKRLHEHRMKTDVEYAKKMNKPASKIDYNFNDVKKKKMKGII